MARERMPSAPHEHTDLVPRSTAPIDLLNAARAQAGGIFLLRTDVQDMRSAVEALTEKVEELVLSDATHKLELANTRTATAVSQLKWTILQWAVGLTIGVVITLLMQRIFH